MQRNGEKLVKIFCYCEKNVKKKCIGNVVSTASAICGVKPEHWRLKPYGNP
jgi:hypothetical protein